MIVEDLTKNRLFHIQATTKHKLTVTGENAYPFQVRFDEHSRCQDMETHHEEADIIIIHQTLQAIKDTQNPRVRVISDDTDVFVLLLHHYQKAGLDIPITMDSPIKDRASVDIQKTVASNKNILKDLPQAHALTGCDTVATCHGIGKCKVLKLLEQGYALPAVGDVNADMEDVILQATSFVSACYGIKNSVDMTQTRLLVWGKKTGRGKITASHLCELPPTTEAFIQNIKRAHYQAIIWRNIDIDPRNLDLECYGWKKDREKKISIPIMLPGNTPPAPNFILQLIRCSCKSKKPCNTKRCSCKEKGVSCTMFCACYSIGCTRLL